MVRERKKNVFVIVDGNAIIHRAYHALPPLTTKEGTMVNAVYGFATTLLRMFKELQPTHVAVTFDLAGPTFRDELYEDYKGTRAAVDQELYDQIPLIHELVEAFNIPIVAVKGFEADDCIGTLVEKLRTQKDTQVIIVTGDMDTLQLVGDTVTVETMRKGVSDLVRYDAAAVAQRYNGLTPEQVVDFKALKGDTSDNIKGVKGIGEKTAITLIKEFGSLDALYAALEKGAASSVSASVQKKLAAGKRDAYLSQELATIRRDVPIDFKMSSFARQPMNEQALISLLQQCEFTSLLYRIPGMQKSTADRAQTKKQTKKRVLVEITSENFDNECARIAACKQVAWRLHRTRGNFLDSEILGVALVADDHAWYVSVTVKHWEKVLHIAELQYACHDVKSDMELLLAHHIAAPKNVFDIMIGAFLLYSDGRAHDLPGLALKYLGVRIESANAQESLFGAPKEALVHEATYIHSIAEDVRKEMEEMVAWNLYEKIEEPLISVLSRMEMHGVAIDSALLKKLGVEVDVRIETLTTKIYKEAGKEFNINSSAQLRDILFDTLQLPTMDIKKGKTGYSTAASELEKLHGIHPIIELIEEYRELMKLKTTYIDVLPTLVHPKSGRIHTTYNQTGAATGRLSSSDPNLQNIPIRTEEGRKVRDAFVAEPGNVLIAADYSQIELRIVASLAQDEEMISIFKNNEDIHKSTAAKIHGVALAEVTPDMRRSAKEVNFGVLYGMGAFGLASRTGISRAEAQEFIDKYFQAFKGVKKYVDETIVLAKSHGYVETLFGRRRYIPEINAGNYQLRSAAERMAVNHPIQGTAADLMKLAMIALDREIEESPDREQIKMILQVHDEVVFEVKKELAEQWAKRVQQIMEGVVELRVPVEAHVGMGTSWGKAK